VNFCIGGIYAGQKEMGDGSRTTRLYMVRKLLNVTSEPALISIGKMFAVTASREI
jgi:hypothetical protein